MFHVSRLLTKTRPPTNMKLITTLKKILKNFNQKCCHHQASVLSLKVDQHNAAQVTCRKCGKVFVGRFARDFPVKWI